MFHEIQKFPMWIYALIVPSLITVMAILWNSYSEAVGEDAKEEVLWAMVVVLITETLAIVLINLIRQEVRIDKTGVHYRYTPFKIKFVTIPLQNIEKYDLDSYNGLNYGYKAGFWSILTKEPSVTMAGLEKVVRIYYNDKTLLIGTRKPSEFIDVLHALTTKNYEE